MSEGLPAWIGLARWFVLPAYAFLATVVLVRVFQRIVAPRPPSEPLPWPENAEALQQAAVASVLAVFVTVVQLALVLGDQIYGPRASMPRPLVAVILAALVLALWGEYRRSLRQLGGLSLSWRSFLRQRLLWALLVKWPAWWATVFVLCSPGSGSDWRWAYLVVGVALYVALFFGLGQWLAARAGWLRPAGERLRAIHARLAQRAGLAPSRIREIELLQPNALFFAPGNEVLVTRGALELLKEDELEGVLAHELGHLSERRRLLVASVPIHVAYLGMLFAGTLLHGMEALWGALAFLSLVLALRFFPPRFLRAAEERADAFARRHSDPAAFARALEVIHREGRVPPRLGRYSSHPDLARRVDPDGAGPRSAPIATPRKHRFGTAGPMVVAFMLAFGLRDVLMGPADELAFPRLTLALRGPEPFSLAGLAQSEERAGRDLAALRLYRAGGGFDPVDPWWPMEEARLLVHLGRCDEARARFAEAERRCLSSGEHDCEAWLAQGRESLSGCP